ncbi:MAG: hypothetical protein Q8P05_06200 [Candidatus Diapherotrites archaeon]|nr:hypothetical protein [Candidatus Diapherotrites archaeon]
MGSRERRSYPKKTAKRDLAFLEREAKRANVWRRGIVMRPDMVTEPRRPIYFGTSAVERVYPDMVKQALSSHYRGSSQLMVNLFGRNRRYRSITYRLAALRRLHQRKVAEGEADLKEKRREYRTTRNRMGKIRIQTISELKGAVPVLLGFHSAYVKYIEAEINRLDIELDWLTSASSLTGATSKYRERYIRNLETWKSEWRKEKRKVEQLLNIGPEIKAFEGYSLEGIDWKRKFVEAMDAHQDRLQKNLSPSPQLIDRFFTSGINYYSRDIQRLTYELKILRLTGLRFKGRTRDIIRKDLEYSKKALRRFQREMGN